MSWLAEEAALLMAQEQWVQRTARQICENRGMDTDVVVPAVRWTVMWLDDFKALYEVRDPKTQEDVRQCIREARESSLQRTEGVPRYPTGLPSLRAIIAANDALCIAYGDERVRKLI